MLNQGIHRSEITSKYQVSLSICQLNSEETETETELKLASEPSSSKRSGNVVVEGQQLLGILIRERQKDHKALNRRGLLEQHRVAMSSTELFKAQTEPMEARWPWFSFIL